MTSFDMRRASNDYRENALMGTWAKSGKSRYTRSTGEVVEKINNRWEFEGMVYSSASAAMWNADGLYRTGKRKESGK